MGRTPRLLNPDDGPLQAFAHDLRLLREKAGNPTYRALAKTAGFSASTLGEAAGGVRRPSLDVTLAFVGACGGDVEAWQERWYQLDRQLTAEQLEQAGQESRIEARDDSAAVATAGAAGPADAAASWTAEAEPSAAADSPAEPSPAVNSGLQGAPLPPQPPEATPLPPASAPSRRRRHALVAVAALTALSVIAFVGARWNAGHAAASTNHPALTAKASPSPSSHCVVAGPKGLFGGSTRGSGARIRAGASMADNVVRTIQPFCDLQFDGYCLGDVVADAFGGTPDMRWFEVSGGGVVSSAVIHGNPPTGLKPSACPDSVPNPTSIALSVAVSADSPGAFELHATGVHVWIVGFATVPDDRSGGPVPATAKWQQIGMVGSTATGFTLAWSARPSGAAGSGVEQSATTTAADRVPIVAVACYGGQGATDVMDPESVSITDPSQATPLPLTSSQRAAAADAACSYPRP
jgi:helix-turn-helix protein